MSKCLFFCKFTKYYPKVGAKKNVPTAIALPHFNIYLCQLLYHCQCYSILIGRAFLPKGNLTYVSYFQIQRNPHSLKQASDT